MLNEQAATKWTDVTEADILAFLGFAILMGINKLPALVHYWCKSSIFRYSPIADRISRDCFLEFWRFLHFVDITSLSDRGYDRLGKVQPHPAGLQLQLPWL